MCHDSRVTLKHWERRRNGRAFGDFDLLCDSHVHWSCHSASYLKQLVSNPSLEELGLTAATTVRLVPLRQLWGVWTMTESCTGYPAPLLLYVCELTRIVKDDIEVEVEIFELKE